MNLFRYSALIAFVGLIFTAPTTLWAQVNGDAISKTGLVVHWDANIGGSGLKQGPLSFVLWPHTTHKREFVTVRLGNRILERIDGNEIDRETADKAIVEGAPLAKAPLLHLEGAKKRAEKLVKTYNRLGRKPTVEEFSQPLIYAVTVSSLGIIQVMDAETGAVVWQAEVANSHFPVLGPGVSDEFVSVTNGNVLYVYGLETGDLISTRKVPFTPTGASQPFHDKIMVPCVGGRLVAFDARKPKVEPIILRTGDENDLGTTVSADRDYIAWTSKSQFIIAKTDRAPSLWSSVRVHDQSFPSRPIAIQDGYIVLSSNGSLFRIKTLDRLNSIVWRTNLGLQTSLAPVVGKELALIVSDDDQLFAVNLSDGKDAWGRVAKNVTGVLGIGRESAYVRLTSGELGVIDLRTGVEKAQASVVLPELIPNSISDRLFVCSNLGALTCLREADAMLPTLFTTIDQPSAEEAVNRANAKKNTTPSTTEDDGDSLFGGAGATEGESESDSSDPFSDNM